MRVPSAGIHSQDTTLYMQRWGTPTSEVEAPLCAVTPPHCLWQGLHRQQIAHFKAGPQAISIDQAAGAVATAVDGSAAAFLPSQQVGRVQCQKGQGLYFKVQPGKRCTEHDNDKLCVP